MSGSLPQAPAHIELTLVGVRRRIRTAQGLTVPVVTARGVPEPDVVLVPAFGDKMPDTLSARLTRPDVPDAVAVLQQWSTAGAHLGAACSGSFLLAESGLLDGHRATTSWRSEEHTSELQSLMRISYAVLCLKKTNTD